MKVRSECGQCVVLSAHLSGQEVEDEAEDAASQDDRGTVGSDGEVDW